jgi:hypothetical protein
MTHTKTTSIGASAQFGRQNRRFKGQEVVYQSSHVLKETKACLGGQDFLDRKNDGGVSGRRWSRS